MILLVIVMSQGCAWNKEYVPVIDNSHMDVVLPEPINYIDIDFEILDGNYCLSTNNYKNLAENMLEIQRYIKQNRIIIREHNKLYGDKEDE